MINLVPSELSYGKFSLKTIRTIEIYDSRASEDSNKEAQENCYQDSAKLLMVLGAVTICFKFDDYS